MHCQILYKADKVICLGDKIGFAVDLNKNSYLRPGVYIRLDNALRCDASRTFLRLCKTFLAQKIKSLLHISFGLFQRILAVHYPGAGLVPEFLYHCCGNFHYSLSSL